MSLSVHGGTQSSGGWVTKGDRVPARRPSSRGRCQLPPAAGPARCAGSGVKAFPWEPLLIEKDSG